MPRPRDLMTKPPDEKGEFTTDTPTLVRMVSGTGKLIGAVLGNQYKIVEVIGEGGIGVVYRAKQLTVDRDVAIKILKKQFANDELAARRFENEALAIGRLRHPNTLRLYDCQRTPGGELYIVTELLSGSPLGDVLKENARLPVERAVRMFDEVCRSLSEAHAAGIVHRDLKPANIFLDRIGSEDVVKVLDFGIAKILQGSGGLTRAGAVPGTPHYMSPEQASAQKIDHRADIYSIGIILYQMLAGQPPFDGASVMDILRKHIIDPPPALAETAPGVEVPAELEQLIRWMLEKAPEDRPQSVDEIRRYLPGILAIAAPVKPLTIPTRPSEAPLSFEDVTGSPPPSEKTTFDARTLAPPDETAVGNAPRVSRWRSLSMITGALGILLGVVIGYASTRREIVIPPRNDAKSAGEPMPALARQVAVGSSTLASAGTELMPPLPPLVPPASKATIASDPSGAAVIAPDGTKLGNTPLEVTLEGSKTFVVVNAKGVSAMVKLDAAKDAGRTLRVSLEDPRPRETQQLQKKKKPIPPPKKRGR